MSSVQTMLQDVIDGKRISKVLEVGAGRGDFIKVLVECFDEQTHITGIDKIQEYLDSARETFKDENVTLHKMDAESLMFEDNLFDIVCISNTLHHLLDVPKVLGEMKRVVKPNGYVVIHEMINDNQSEKQNVHVWLHHLSAEIDCCLGNHHGFTYQKSEIMSFINNSNLEAVSELEYIIEDETSEKEILDTIISVLHKRISEIDDIDMRNVFQQRLNENTENLYEIGFSLATEYVVVSSVK